MFIYYHTSSYHTTPTKHHWKHQHKSKEVASETANADSHSNQPTLISHQASHRPSVAANVEAVQSHVSRIHVQAVHTVATDVSRRPPVTAATLTARAILVVDARTRFLAT